MSDQPAVTPEGQSVHLVGELSRLKSQLAEAVAALRACREDSCELLGERGWWKDEEHHRLAERYHETAENIVRADLVLEKFPEENP